MGTGAQRYEYQVLMIPGLDESPVTNSLLFQAFKEQQVKQQTQKKDQQTTA